MIRSVLGLFIFAVALCAYIVTRPNPVPQPVLPVGVATDVTRAATQSLLPGLPLPAEAKPVIAAPRPAAVPTPKIETDDNTITATTSNVLAGLGLGLDVPAASGTAAPAPASALENLVVAALKEGRPDAEIDSLINTAALAGDLTVPEILVTSDGRVDTAILLQSIVAQAQIAAGGAAPAVPDVPTGDGTGVEVRVVQRAAKTEQYRFYTVNPGDSLGAIAVKFYGNVDKYPLIFEANRQILSSPDRIRIGQRLTIPDLPEV